MKSRFLHLKICLVVLLFLSLFFTPATRVSAQNTNTREQGFKEIFNAILNDLDLTSIEGLFNDYYSGENLFEVIEKAIKGEFLSFESLADTIVALLKSNTSGILSSFTSIILIVLACSLISALKSEKDRIGDLIFMVCYAFICLILFIQVGSSINQTKQITTSVCKQIDGIFPILLTLMSATGANASVSVFQPITILFPKLLSSLTHNALFPIITICAVLAVISSISVGFSLEKMQNFFSSCFKWIIGIVVAVFSIFSAVKGISAINYDNFTLRALKYTVGNTFPLIGNFAKEGIDVIITSGVLIKNAIGSISIILLFFALISPILKIILLSLGLKFLSGIVEPIADVRITRLIFNFSKVISMLSTLLLTIFIVYAVNFLLIISAQNGLIT